MFNRTHVMGTLLFFAYSLLLFGHRHDSYAKPEPVTVTATVGPIRTYQFASRITDNGGVRPFRVGDVITGNFSYDLEAMDKATDHREHGWYDSSRNALFFEINGLRFTGVGKVAVTTGTWKHAEHFTIVAHDAKLPAGWDIDHRGPSQSYGFLLQNAPSKHIVDPENWTTS